MKNFIVIDCKNYKQLINNDFKRENICFVDIRNPDQIYHKLDVDYPNINIPVNKLEKNIDVLNKCVPVFYDGNGMLISYFLKKIFALKIPKSYILSCGYLTTVFAE